MTTKRFCALLAVLLATFATPILAQPIAGFLEGPLTNLDVVNRTATINGVLMNIPPGVPMSSPTVDLNELAASLGVDAITLIGGASLPGRSAAGFTEGTCLCATEVDPATGTVTATDMVLEPAENVLIATVTTHSCATQTCDPDDDPANELRVGGTLMDINTDARLVSDPAGNRGFEVDLTLGNLVGVMASAEGYFGEDGQLHLYTLEIDGGVLLNAGVTEVSITRAQCRQRDGMAEWGVRGSTHDPNSGTVTFRRGDDNTVIGTAAVLPEADAPTFGAYDFDAELVGDCADSIIAEFSGASTTSDVDVRIDEDEDDPVDPPPPPPPGGGSDAIAIDKARWRADKDQLRVEGVVTPGGAMPASVSIFAPGNLDGTGDGCTGTLVATPAVDALGEFDFRDRGGFPTNPGTVCVSSPNGGASATATTGG